MSSVGVGSTSGHTLGLNPSAFAVNRSSVAAVTLGSIGTVGGTFGQSSVRPLLLCRVKWWENVASGNTLFPGADISETGEFG